MKWLDQIRDFLASREVAALKMELASNYTDLNKISREYEEKLEEVNASRQRLMDENMELRARISEVEPRLAQALERESTAVKAVADFLAQQYFGRSIWAVGLPLPEPKEELQPVRRRAGMDEMQQESIRKFYEEAFSRQSA